MEKTTRAQFNSGGAPVQPINSDRIYVESVWEKVIELRSIFTSYSMGVKIFIPLGGFKRQKFYFSTWYEAADFTRTALEDLQKLDEEILWTMKFRFNDDFEIYERLRSRLDAIRENAIRGMKPEFISKLNERIKNG